MTSQRTFGIRRVEAEHTCLSLNKTGKISASIKWVTRTILQDVRENPNVTPKEIIKFMSTGNLI